VIWRRVYKNNRSVEEGVEYVSFRWLVSVEYGMIWYGRKLHKGLESMGII
jgi:hypothetical protein